MKLLIKFARSVVTLIGKSFHDVASALQDFDHGDTIPIGIISSNPSESMDDYIYEEAYDEDDENDWGDQTDQKIYYYDHQSQIMSNQDAIKFSEDAELLNQINIGLEIIANDDHFNADLADAAFLYNEKDVAIKNAHSMDDYWIEGYAYEKERNLDSKRYEDILPRMTKPFTKKHQQMQAIGLLLNSIITGSSEFTKESETKIKSAIKETLEGFRNEKLPILSSIPIPEGRSKSSSSSATKVFSFSPSILDALESLRNKTALEEFQFKNVKKRYFQYRS